MENEDDIHELTYDHLHGLCECKEGEGRPGEMSHTPRPWRVVNRPSRGIQIEWGGDEDGTERPIAHMRWTDGLNAEVEKLVLRDAHILAAAPELLEAAKKALAVAEEWIYSELHGTNIHDRKLAELDSVRAAIAKAEGRGGPTGS